MIHEDTDGRFKLPGFHNQLCVKFPRTSTISRTLYRKRLRSHNAISLRQLCVFGKSPCDGKRRLRFALIIASRPVLLLLPNTYIACILSLSNQPPHTNARNSIPVFTRPGRRAPTERSLVACRQPLHWWRPHSRWPFLTLFFCK